MLMDQIRELRQAKGLSQAKLAVTAGMDPATLNRIEQGKGNPNLKTLQRLAATLGVEVSDLLTRAEASPAQLEKTIYGVWILSRLDGSRRLDNVLYEDRMEAVRFAKALGKDEEQMPIGIVADCTLRCSEEIKCYERLPKPSIAAQNAAARSLP